MKLDQRNGGARIDTDIPQPTDAGDWLDAGIVAARMFILMLAVLSLTGAGFCVVRYFGWI